MIFEPQKFTYIVQDGIYSIAPGFIAGFFYRLLDVFMPKGKVKVFIKDLLTAVLFTVLMYSYVVSFANYRVLRWYNVLFGLAGMILFNPVFNTALKVALALAQILRSAALFKTVKSAKKHRSKLISKQKEKSQKNTTKNSSQLLKQDGKILYN